MEINGIQKTREILEEEQERLKKIKKINQAVLIKNDLYKNNNQENNKNRKNSCQDFYEILQEKIRTKKLK